MTNSFPNITFIYDRYKKASCSKQATIEMRISFNRKQKYISTGIKLYPNQWKQGKVINTPDAIQLNQTLDQMLTNVRQVIYDMFKAGNIDIFAIPQKLKSKKERIDIIQYFKERSAVRKYGKAKDTQERYDRFIRLFKKWGKIKSFDDITDTKIIQYDKHLTSLNMKPYSKWQNYHRFLNSFIMDAIDTGYLKKNPYKWVNIDKGDHDNSLGKCLTLDEFHQIQTVQLSTKSLEKVRDMFVFQTYTCLAYTDLKKFDTSKIETINDMQVYTGKREKTGKAFTIPLLQSALEILHKYNYNLPIISNEKYNDYLKLLAIAAGINKPISSHWARHTGATLLLNKGVSMQIVSKICGHTSTRITEKIYAKLLDETIVKALHNIKDF